MRVFVCEYLTSGGVRDKPLPEGLLAEGLLMRDALIRDIEELPGASVILAHDDRLPAPDAESVPVRQGEDPLQVWSGLARTADVVWPVAPESEGILERVVARLDAAGRRLIASSPSALAITASKLATARRLAEHAIPHIPTFPVDALPADIAGEIVTKPDRGAGCENTRAWPGRAALPEAEGLVAQPFVPGIPASLSVLVRPDGVTLLAVNRQHVSQLVGVFALDGLTVGGIPDESGSFAALARRVVAAVPGLAGIIGIDLILADGGPVVVEINGRITTAYAGLHAALGVNPAAFLPQLIRDGRPPAVPHLPRPSPVEVKIR